MLKTKSHQPQFSETLEINVCDTFGIIVDPNVEYVINVATYEIRITIVNFALRKLFKSVYNYSRPPTIGASGNYAIAFFYLPPHLLFRRSF